MQKLFQQVLEGQPIPEALRHRIRWPDGSLHWLEISGRTQTDANGHTQVFGVIRDITEQQQQQQALRESQERLNLALESANLGIWDWHIPSGTLYGSGVRPACTACPPNLSMASSASSSAGCQSRINNRCARPIEMPMARNANTR